MTESDAGWRLDHWLANRFTYQSRSRWQVLVKDGYLRVNSQDAKPSYLLQEGDEVEETEVTEQNAETVEGEADQSDD